MQNLLRARRPNNLDRDRRIDLVDYVLGVGKPYLRMDFMRLGYDEVIPKSGRLSGGKPTLRFLQIRGGTRRHRLGDSLDVRPLRSLCQRKL